MNMRDFEKICNLLPSGYTWGCALTTDVALHIVQAALASQAQQEPVSQWQPIETAPKNKHILVCQSQNGIIRTACGTDEQGNWKTGPSIMSYIVGVTHWMPLPLPPAPEGDKTK